MNDELVKRLREAAVNSGFPKNELYDEAASALAASGRDAWVPVSERLPEDDEEVLMVGRWGWRGEAVMDIGRYDHQQKWWRPRGSNGDFTERMIVWMPLPPTPTEAK